MSELTYPTKDESPSPCRMLCHHTINQGANRPVFHRLSMVIAHHAARDAHQPACSPLSNSTLSGIGYSLDLLRYAYHFFALISFITSISRSRSATNFFRRAFSCIILLSSDTWGGIHATEFSTPDVNRMLRNLILLRYCRYAVRM